jgi:catechol 2,3-dioxygenase-like lactoylglutathione lyase family enzyme
MTDLPSPVTQLRLVVEAADYEEALRFYRDALGMPQELAVAGPDGAHVTIPPGRGRRDTGRAADRDAVALAQLASGCAGGPADHALPGA